MNEKEKRQKQNERIREAVLVAQMMETKGFKIFKDWLENRTNEFRFQDVMGLSDEKTVITQQGYIVAYGDVKQFFEEKNVVSQKPMIDEDTGEPEIMNKKKVN